MKLLLLLFHTNQVAQIVGVAERTVYYSLRKELVVGPMALLYPPEQGVTSWVPLPTPTLLLQLSSFGVSLTSPGSEQMSSFLKFESRMVDDAIQTVQQLFTPVQLQLETAINSGVSVPVEMLTRHCEYLRKKKRTLLLCGGMYARTEGPQLIEGSSKKLKSE